MACFTSTRERRLWAWALAMLSAVLASALFAGSLVESLRSQQMLAVAFGASFAVAITAVLGIALRRRSQHLQPWLGLAVVTALAMVPVRSGLSPLERTHLFEYGLLAVVLYEALLERSRQTPLPRPGLTAIITAALFGWLDEGLQALVPGRVYDTRDIGINALAALIAVSTVAAIRWGRDQLGDSSDRSAAKSSSGHPEETPGRDA